MLRKLDYVLVLVFVGFGFSALGCVGPEFDEVPADEDVGREESELALAAYPSSTSVWTIANTPANGDKNSTDLFRATTNAFSCVATATHTTGGAAANCTARSGSETMDQTIDRHIARYWVGATTVSSSNTVNPPWFPSGAAQGKYRQIQTTGSGRQFIMYHPLHNMACSVGGAFRTTHSQNGYEFGTFGFPVTEECVVATNPWRVIQYYDRGVMFYDTSLGGVNYLYGQTAVKWNRIKMPSYPGAPTYSTRPTPDGLGTFTYLEGGAGNPAAMYWHPELGTFELHGTIWNEWTNKSREQGQLGWPTSDELCEPVPDGANNCIYRYQRFQGGVIKNWTSPARAFIEYVGDRLDVSTLSHPTNALVETVAGRTNKLRVSMFSEYSWAGTPAAFSFSGAHQLRLRSRCIDTGGDVSDPGLLVEEFASDGVTSSGTVFNNDDGRANYQTNYKNSYVDMGARTTARKYRVYLFSMRRNTATCGLQYSTNGTTFVDVMADGATVFQREVGGTVVSLGKLLANDRIEILTRNGGLDYSGAAGTNDLKMVLFDQGVVCDSRGAACAGRSTLAGDDQGNDRDPAVTVPSTGWGNNMAFVLLGSKARGTASDIKGYQAVADLLVTNPSDATPPQAMLVPNGCSIITDPNCTLTVTYPTLQPGRWSIRIPAGTTRVVADANEIGWWSATVPLDIIPGYPNWTGTLNKVAFYMWVDREMPGGGWARVTPMRPVALGAFGAANLDHHFEIDVDVRSPGKYRISTGSQQSYVTTGLTFYRRNRETSELKVATLNMLYESDLTENSKGDPVPGYVSPQAANAAFLLTGATRGGAGFSYDIIDAPDQGPFLWDADIVSLQEMRSNYSTATFFKDYARFFSPLEWNYVYARGEEFDWTEDSHIALFSNENTWLAGQDFVGGAQFSTADVSSAGCINNEDAANKDECWTAFEGHWLPQTGDTNFHATPLRAYVERKTTTQKKVPLIVLAFHGSNKDLGVRGPQYLQVADKLSRLNQTQGRSDGDVNNRLIVVGDTNLDSFEGEHHQLIKVLRDRFGYAVDTSYAVDGTTKYGYGGLNYASDSDIRQTPDAWAALAEPGKWYINSSPSRYQWWAKTWRGQVAGDYKSGKRHDVVFLVGKGWATDDAVRGYEVMAADRQPGPFNPSGLAVEMWPVGGGVNDGDYNFSPPYNAGGGLGQGRAALQTDHKPVAARLRIGEGL